MAFEVKDLIPARKVVSLAKEAAMAGEPTNVGLLVTEDGREVLVAATASSGTSPVQEALDTQDTVTKEGTVLYSYGSPELQSVDLSFISRVVVVNPDVGSENRQSTIYSFVDVDVVPPHPSLDVFAPVRILAELS